MSSNIFEFKKGNPEFVYFNFTVGNKQRDTDSKNIAVIYEEERANNIINDCSEYFLSVSKFQLNGVGKKLPLIIPQVELNQTDLNKLIYNLNVELKFYDGGNNHTTSIFSEALMSSLNFLHKDYDISQAGSYSRFSSAPITEQPIGDDYFIYNYYDFLKIVNRKFQELVEDVVQKSLLPNSLPVGTVSPFLTTALRPKHPVMDYENGKFSLKLDKRYFGEKRTNQSVELIVYCDSNFHGLFTYFPWQHLGSDINNSMGFGNFSYRLEVPNVEMSSYVQEVGDYYQLKQEKQSNSTLWSPVQSLVFTTTSLPIISEELGNPRYLDQDGKFLNQDTSSTFINQIKEFNISLLNASDYNEYISFSDKGIREYTCLVNNPVGIRRLDMRIFWRNRLNGVLHPLILHNQGTCHFKLVFTRKDYA